MHVPNELIAALIRRHTAAIGCEPIGEDTAMYPRLETAVRKCIAVWAAAPRFKGAGAASVVQFIQDQPNGEDMDFLYEVILATLCRARNRQAIQVFVVKYESRLVAFAHRKYTPYRGRSFHTELPTLAGVDENSEVMPPDEEGGLYLESLAKYEGGGSLLGFLRQRIRWYFRTWQRRIDLEKEAEVIHGGPGFIPAAADGDSDAPIPIGSIATPSSISNDLEKMIAVLMKILASECPLEDQYVFYWLLVKGERLDALAGVLGKDAGNVSRQFNKIRQRLLLALDNQGILIPESFWDALWPPTKQNEAARRYFAQQIQGHAPDWCGRMESSLPLIAK